MSLRRKGSSIPRPWTPRDLKLTRSLARRGMSARQAAPLVGRTVGALKWKAMVEGISFRFINQKPGTQRTAAQRRRLSRITAARHRLARAGRR